MNTGSVMKLNSISDLSRSASRAAYTVVEVMMAGSISVIVLGALMTLVFQMAKEQKFGLADGSVQYKAGLVEDKIAEILRVMSVDESAVFADAVSGNPGTYRRVIFARGPSSEHPREELYFNSATGVLFHDPNRSLEGDQVALFSPDKFTALREVYFYPSLKVGNMIDNTTINVVLKFDDDGYSMRKETSGEIKKMTVNRYFTVKFRN
jgi:hypothetical protein